MEKIQKCVPILVIKIEPSRHSFEGLQNFRRITIQHCGEQVQRSVKIHVNSQTAVEG